MKIFLYIIWFYKLFILCGYPEYSFQLFFVGGRTQGFYVQAEYYYMMGSAGKSKVPSMKKARFRLDLHAMVHKAPNVPTEHFNTGLKHQRLRTAFSWKHIWNLPAIYTLVIYKNIFQLNS